MNQMMKRNRQKLRDARKNESWVRFDYIGKNGDRISNVRARVLGERNGDTPVFEFGVVRNENSSAHPGFRPLGLDRVRGVRVSRAR
jgi:hypothetical protein